MARRKNGGGDYDVGYGKPPVHSRFKPGQSGNPRGRQRGSRNASSLAAQALAEKVTVTIEGRTKRISKLEAAMIQQSNKAAAGDPKAVKLMTDLMEGFDERAVEGSLSPDERRARHQLVLAALKGRRSPKGGSDDPA